jgi:hypothetical protein
MSRDRISSLESAVEWTAVVDVLPVVVNLLWLLDKFTNAVVLHMWQDKIIIAKPSHDWSTDLRLRLLLLIALAMLC